MALGALPWEGCSSIIFTIAKFLSFFCLASIRTLSVGLAAARCLLRSVLGSCKLRDDLLNCLRRETGSWHGTQSSRPRHKKLIWWYSQGSFFQLYRLWQTLLHKPRSSYVYPSSQSGFGWGVFEKIKTATAASAVFHIVVISTGTKHDCEISR